MSKYVQHKSGHGEKWPLADCQLAGSNVWDIAASTVSNYLVLPKSEYVEVPGPEVWVDVTSECLVHCMNRILHPPAKVTVEGCGPYRLRKVQLWTVQPCTNILGEAQWAFMVEQKQE
jgi:hypothetical protein